MLGPWTHDASSFQKMIGKRILFINHRPSQCGVYEFGRNIGLTLERAASGFFYRECGSADALIEIIGNYRPDAIVYNYHPATMAWLNVSLTKRIRCPQLGIIHEVTQEIADKADTSLFNFHIAHDPTLLIRNPIVYKAGRLVPRYQNNFELPPVTTIGSFGFAGKKGQRKIVERVSAEFDQAIVCFNIPFATFGDADGKLALEIAEDCRKAARPGIELVITHDFMTQRELLDFLAQNTVNLFFYESMTNEARGISAVPDLALAVNRPIGITRQKMFRHIANAVPSICIEDSSIKQIIENGTEPIDAFSRDWTEEGICWDYERIISDVFSRSSIPNISDPNRFALRVKRKLKKVLRIPKHVHAGTLTASADAGVLPDRLSRRPSYRPVAVPNDWPLNNILDEKARRIYAGTIDQMFAWMPELMKRKILEANVQQAFVLDTVYRLIVGIRAKTLCVGSYEDSAAEFLKLMALKIEGIDPVINYDLETFMTKPTTVAGSYDVVFSTSVIEHVGDDVKFLKQIASLLKPGGMAVLTCDFKGDFMTGDPKPAIDQRLYTRTDLEQRLLNQLPDCRLVDEPNWNCPNPDFWYEGVNYTFASIVFRKRVEES